MLADFARGDMRTAPAQVIQSHLDHCSDCSAQLAALDHLSGEMLSQLPASPMATGALYRLMQRLGSIGQEGRAAPRSRLVDGIELPAAVARIGLHPRRWLMPGFWAAHVRMPREDNWRLFLLRAPARTSIPRHFHRGDELVSVLMGAFQDGETYVAGDFAAFLEGDAHTLDVGDDSACICLIAVRGPIAWRGWGRLAGPVLGV